MSVMVPPLPGDTCLRRTERFTVVEDVFLTWQVVPDVADAVQRRKRGAPAWEPAEERIARLVDVSGHGAAVVAPVDEDLQEDSRVRVGMGRGAAMLRVVHWVDLDEPGWRLYGTEFVDADATFRRYVGWWLESDTDDGRVIGDTVGDHEPAGELVKEDSTIRYAVPLDFDAGPATTAPGAESGSDTDTDTDTDTADAEPTETDTADDAATEPDEPTEVDTDEDAQGRTGAGDPDRGANGAGTRSRRRRR